MTDPAPKRQAGRPVGYKKHDEPVTERHELKLTKKAKDWIESKPRGWLPNLIEEMARK